MDISRELESRAELRLCCDCPSVLGELTPNEIQIVRKSDTQPMAPQGHKVDFALAEFISYFGAKQIPVATHIGQPKSRLPKIKRPVCQAHGETPKCQSQCLRAIIAQRQAQKDAATSREERKLPSQPRSFQQQSSRGLALGAGGWGETRWDSRMPKTAQSTESDGGPVQIYQARGQGLGQEE